MATPFAHASVTHVSKMRRRRSRSVTLPNEVEADAPEKTKQFFIELQKERQKQQNNRFGRQKEQSDNDEEQDDDDDDNDDDDDDSHTVVTRVPGMNKTHPTNKQRSSSAFVPGPKNTQRSLTSIDNRYANDNEIGSHPNVARTQGGNNTQSTKNHTSLFGAKSILSKEQRAVTHRTNPGVDDDEQHQMTAARINGGNNTQSTKNHTSLFGVKSVSSKDQKSMIHRSNSGADDDEQHPVATARVNGGNNTQSTKNNTSSFGAKSGALKEQKSLTNRRNSGAEGIEQRRASITRVKRSENTASMKKNPPSSMGAMSNTLHPEVASITSNDDSSEGNELSHRNRSQGARIPRSESTKPLTKQITTKSAKNQNINVFTTVKNSNKDSSVGLKGIYLESSQASSNLLASSSTNLMSKSEIFDQDFHLDDDKGHTKRNDGKRHGKIDISGKEKNYSTYDRRLTARSSAAFMTAIIAIVIAIIAFAFALTSLVLVLLLRSTVYAVLTSNSSNSSSSSISLENWPTGCWNYTTLDDPTRSVNAPGYALGCDNTAPFINRTLSVWIRFIGTGGTTLPLTTPGMNICGSEGTGWYDGVMPSISGQLLNGTACFSWYTSVCRYSQSISVANCGSYYVYLLPPAPACMMRYCTI